MARRTTEHIITGFDPHLRMCFYHSPYFGQNIWRRGSSLTGERTKTDPAFKGFRQSSSRLKEASPIAASLYRLIPVEQKQYAVYRTLTGEVIKMLKEGTEPVIITESLKKKYIDPLVDTLKKTTENRTVNDPEIKDRVKGMNDLTTYPPIPPRIRKMTRTRRSFLIQQITAGHSQTDYSLPTGSDPLPHTDRDISTFLLDQPQEPKRRIKNTDGLIYIGRLPECKKLKIWLRPVESTLNK